VILADTSVWIDHLRNDNARMVSLLDEGVLMTHPFVVGELACGMLANREQILQELAELPSASVAEHEEVLRLVEAKQLHSRGVGWIDVHLLAATILSGCRIWTLDKALERLATELRIAG
jgi:predicted nucleic acid-binding protein